MADQKYIVVLASDTMGEGNEELGGVLIKAFLSNLLEQDQAPDQILLYNTGVRLIEEGAAPVDDFKALAEAGSEILACGTCVDFFDIKERLAVGEISNMKTIIERIRAYDRVVRP